MQLCILDRNYDDDIRASEHCETYEDYVEETTGEDCIGAWDEAGFPSGEIRPIYDRVDREREREGTIEIGSQMDIRLIFASPNVPLSGALGLSTRIKERSM